MKRNVVVIVALIAVIIVINITNLSIKKEEEKEEQAIHAVAIKEEVNLYKKPKEKSKIKQTVNLGENIKILETEDENWYEVKCGEQKGYMKKEDLDYYERKEDEKVLMSDISKFNIGKDFKDEKEYEAFLVKNDIQYVYIRIGGRGYGDEGILYEDPECKTFIEACEYLKIHYGFYFIDEAITEEEISEEVDYIKNLLQENKGQHCVLPLAIDIEKFDVKARTDGIWDKRGSLVTYMQKLLKENDIDSIIYCNAKIADKYLSDVESKFWISYYDQKNKIPWIWYSETDQEPTQNEKLMEKVIAWQFTENGAGDEVEEKVDISIVKNGSFGVGAFLTQ